MNTKFDHRLNMAMVLLFLPAITLFAATGTYAPERVVNCVVPALMPVVECVGLNADGTYTAWFSYENTGAPVTVPIGCNNRFVPGPDNRGQPTQFPTGSGQSWPQATFSVTFDGTPLVWQLKDMSVTVSADSPLCFYGVSFAKQWLDATGQPVNPPVMVRTNGFVISVTSYLAAAVGRYSSDGELIWTYTRYAPPGAGSCWPAFISATFSNSLRKVTAVSDKDLSNVVLKFADGKTQKFDGLSGKVRTFAGTGSHAGKAIVGIWIKSGCNGSTDGSGYGQYIGQELPVVAGQAYTVTETLLPPGWTNRCGNGTFLPGQGDCLACGSGAAARYCTHNIINRREPDVTLGALAGVVWLDSDRNDVPDLEEARWPGIGVTLAGPDGLVATQITSTAGYRFSNLPAGTYTVALITATLPDNFIPTYDYDGTNTPHWAVVVLAAGQTNANVNFGYWGPVNLTNWTVTLESMALCQYESGTLAVPGNFAITPPGTRGQLILGWQSLLPASGDAILQTQWVSGAGAFEIAPFWPGISAGATNPIQIRCSAEIRKEDGASLSGRVPQTADVYWYPAVCAPPLFALLGDTVWHDVNGDGVQQPNEPGISGVRLTVSNAATVLETTTDAAGYYLFTNLSAGGWTVAVDAATLPHGWLRTTAFAQLATNLAAGQSMLEADFGYQPRADLEISLHTSPDGCVIVSSNLSLLVTVTNRGPAAATGVRALDTGLEGFIFQGAVASIGTFNMDTGVWIIGDLAPQTAATLMITALADQPGTGTNRAEITASDVVDPDSTPNNAASINEDDNASIELCREPPAPEVSPILECVQNNGNGSYTAWFGYRNHQVWTSTIPIGAQNKFVPAPQDRGQPTSFAPGRTPYWPAAAFGVVFTNGNLVWALDGRTATASTNSTPCSYHVFLEKIWRSTNGVESTVPPDDLPPNYMLIATSRLGYAIGTYPPGATNLVVTYANLMPPALDRNGLWVPCCGESFTVTETNLPAGWIPESGVGEVIPGGTTKFIKHRVVNRDDGSSLLRVDLELEKTVGTYAWRRPIVIPATNLACHLTNYPVLILLDDPALRAAAFGGHVAHTSAYDVVFRLTNGVALPHEIETYDPEAGRLLAWVRMPVLTDAADAVLEVYYGNDAVINPTAGAADVWESDFRMVQHFNHNGPHVPDATGWHHDGVTTAAVFNTAGLAGPAFYFDGSNAYVAIPPAEPLSFTSDFTLEGWFRRAGDVWAIPISKGQQFVCGDYWLRFSELNQISFDVMGIGDVYTTNGISADWHHVVARFRHGPYYWGPHIREIFVDGQLLLSDTYGYGTQGTCTNAPLYLGAYLADAWTPPGFFHGWMDEVRISAGARSDCWIATTHRNLAAPGAFAQVGAEQAVVPGTFEYRVGDDIGFRVVVSNRGPAQASGVQVRDPLPSGYNFQTSYVSQGAYDPGVGVWSLGTLEAGAVAIMWLQADLQSATPPANVAEVSACDQTDVDSLPGNGVESEDDYGSAVPVVAPQYADLELTKGLSRYQYFKRVRINPAQVCGELVEFPLLVNVADANLRYAGYGGQVRHPQGYDIRFVLPAGTVLPFEIEQYNPQTGQLTAWVRMPRLSPNDPATLELLIQYGNAAAQSSPADARQVWSGPYSLVQHMAETNGLLRDSTDWGNHGRRSGVVPGAAGVVGNAIVLNGATELVTVSPHASLQFTNDFTIELWLRRDCEKWAIPLSKGEQFVDGDYWIKAEYARVNFDVMGVGDATLEAPELPMAAWTHVVAVFRRGSAVWGPHTFEVYFNGMRALERTMYGAPLVSDHPLYLGAYLGNLYHFCGALDEVRLAGIGRSDCWIRTTYLNQIDPAGFLSVGTQELAATPYADIGQSLEFVVSVVNRGPSAADGVSVREMLPDGLELQAALPSQGGFDPLSGVWQINDLASGASASLNVTAIVRRGGSQINRAEIIAANQPDPDSTPGNGNEQEDDYSRTGLQDSDHDGMADDWEEYYFLTRAARDGSQDSDGDGISDFDEYIAGTLPTEISSRLGLVNASAVPGSNGLEISWASVPARRYQVFRSSDMAQGSQGFISLAPPVTATHELTTYTDNTATNAGPYFYLVHVVQ